MWRSTWMIWYKTTSTASPSVYWLKYRKCDCVKCELIYTCQDSSFFCTWNAHDFKVEKKRTTTKIMDRIYCNVASNCSSNISCYCFNAYLIILTGAISYLVNMVKAIAAVDHSIFYAVFLSISQIQTTSLWPHSWTHKLDIIFFLSHLFAIWKSTIAANKFNMIYGYKQVL